jgi:hypothetical protein
MPTTITYDEVYGISLRFGIWFGIGLFFTVLFSFLRPQKPDFYAPKATKHQKVENLSPSFLAWVFSSRVLNETRNVDKIGQDAVIFLKFMRLGVELFLKLSILAIPLMLINYFAPKIMNTPDITRTIPALTLLTMGNIQKGSGLFYLHTLYTYISSFMAFYAMYHIWVFYLPMRQEYFESSEYIQEECHRTLLLNELPVSLRDQEAIKRYCEKYGIHLVEDHVHLGKHMGALRKLVEDHSQKVIELENILAHHFRKQTPKTLDQIRTLQDQVRELEKSISQKRSTAYEEFESSPYAFVSFDSVAAAHKALSLLEEGPIPVSLARRPNDIVWKNLEVELEDRNKRYIVALVFNIVLYIFWFCFVWFIGTFRRPARLNRIWPEFEQILESNTPLRIFFESYLGPVCVIITNFILLPRAMTKISDIQMRTSMTDNGHSSLRKFYTFLFYQRILEVLMPLGESIFINLNRGQTFTTAVSNAWATFSGVFVAVSSIYLEWFQLY